MQRLIAAASLPALLSCQAYDFKKVTPLPVDVIALNQPIAAHKGTPSLLIVQDVSGSMCEPIQADAGTNAVTGCASNTSNTKWGIVASSMQTVLDGLNPTPQQFNLGLYALPDKVDSNAGECQAASQPVYAIGDAVTTLPEIVGWYGNLNNNYVSGGTPTAQTLQNALPLFSSTGSGPKYVLLITDGLPNCDDKNACVLDPSNNLWSDGEAHGCESQPFQNWYAYENPQVEKPATPPAQCQCSEGSCTNPDAGNASNDCCVIDPQLLGVGSSNYAQDIVYAAEDCLDTSNTVSAIQALANAGITTYVIGMGFDFNVDPSVLTQMAQAGQPTVPDAGFYDASNSTTLLAAIQEIVQRVTATCVFNLDQNVANPALIEVKLDGNVLTQGDANGYKLTAPDQVTLEGTACSTVEDGSTHDVSIVALAQPQ